MHRGIVDDPAGRSIAVWLTSLWTVVRRRPRKRSGMELVLQYDSLQSLLLVSCSKPSVPPWLDDVELSCAREERSGHPRKIAVRF